MESLTEVGCGSADLDQAWAMMRDKVREYGGRRVLDLAQALCAAPAKAVSRLTEDELRFLAALAALTVGEIVLREHEQSDAA